MVAAQRSTPRAGDAKATREGKGASTAARAEQDPDYIAAVNEASKNAQQIVSQLAKRKASTAWLHAAQRRARSLTEGK